MTKVEEASLTTDERYFQPAFLTEEEEREYLEQKHVKGLPEELAVAA